MEDIRYPKQLPLSSHRVTKTWTTIKETIGRIKSWGRNRSFIDLTRWPEEEEEEEDDDDDDDDDDETLCLVRSKDTY